MTNIGFLAPDAHDEKDCSRRMIASRHVRAGNVPVSMSIGLLCISILRYGLVARSEHINDDWQRMVGIRFALRARRMHKLL